MTDLPKPIKKQLRALADLGHERDLARSLEQLSQLFEQWKAAQVSTWDINQAIHVFRKRLT